MSTYAKPSPAYIPVDLLKTLTAAGPSLPCTGAAPWQRRRVTHSTRLPARAALLVCAFGGLGRSLMPSHPLQPACPARWVQRQLEPLMRPWAHGLHRWCLAGYWATMRDYESFQASTVQHLLGHAARELARAPAAVGGPLRVGPRGAARPPARSRTVPARGVAPHPPCAWALPSLSGGSGHAWWPRQSCALATAPPRPPGGSVRP